MGAAASRVSHYKPKSRRLEHTILTPTPTKSEPGMQGIEVSRGNGQPTNQNIMSENRPNDEPKTTAAATRITIWDTIEIPELLALITDELSTEEQRKLMLISKRFFRCAGPIAWKRVPSFTIVLKLIKGVEGKPGYVYELKQNVDDYVITLPPKPDLSRYEIYSPWIQELEIFAGCPRQIISLEPLLTHLDGRPPLPNLRRLTASLCYVIDRGVFMSFIDMFINPSLIGIRTIISEDAHGSDDVSRISSSSVPAFLQKLNQTCPSIQVLEFYPGHNMYDASLSSWPWCPWYMPDDRCRSTLSSFLSLRSFSSNTYILKPETFGILGELPYLESLGIRGTTREHSILEREEKPLTVLETWFPVLKDLRLYDVHPRDIKTLWNQPRIASRLVSGLIHSDCSDSSFPHQNQPEDLPPDRSWVGPFLAALPRLSPHLQDFALYVGQGGQEGVKYKIPRAEWHQLIADASRKELARVVKHIASRSR